MLRDYNSAIRDPQSVREFLFASAEAAVALNDRAAWQEVQDMFMLARERGKLEDSYAAEPVSEPDHEVIAVEFRGSRRGLVQHL